MWHQCPEDIGAFHITKVSHFFPTQVTLNYQNIYSEIVIISQIMDNLSAAFRFDSSEVWM